MKPQPLESRRPLVQIVGPADNWILEKLARRLASKLPYSEFVPWKPRPGTPALLAYYVNYALYQEPSGLIDVGFFTHRDDSQQFLERARSMDHCVSMSKLYADWLKEHGVHAVTHIPMGCDYYRYRPRLILGVVGLLDHPRKGKHLVETVRQLPFVEVLTTEGKVSEEGICDFYQRLDYVLIPATVEGGPMSVLEGLAMGKPLIAPATVGLIPEFADSPHVRRYPTGDSDALVRLVTECYEEKLERNRLVQDRTWDRWAEAHHRLFVELLHRRGKPVPEPARGFRFGMLAELDIPARVNVEPLEKKLDDVAVQLYYGEYAEARRILIQAVREFPFAAKLLSTIPQGDDPSEAEAPRHVGRIKPLLS
jgi:hypothetical protein